MNLIKSENFRKIRIICSVRRYQESLWWKLPVIWRSSEVLYLQFERDEFNQIWNFPHNPYNPFRPPLSGKSLVATSSALEQLSQGLSQWQRKRRISRISRKFLVFAVVYAVGFAVFFVCVLFFFSCSSQSVIWFRPLFLLLMFVFCVSFFFLLRLSVIHLVIFCLNFFHWRRTMLLLSESGVIIVLHH